MESAQNRKAAKSSERKSTENDSEEELQPPSPIHIAPEAALVPDFDFPDPQELRRIESDTQSRLKAILEVAGGTGLSQIDEQTFQDPAENRKAAKSSERKSTENDSEEELQPPSPIHIAPEAALVPDFDFPDPQELRRIESDTQSRLKAILEVAGVTGLSQIDAQTFQDPEILRKLTNRLVYPWWSCACHMN